MTWKIKDVAVILLDFLRLRYNWVLHLSMWPNFGKMTGTPLNYTSLTVKIYFTHDQVYIWLDLAFLLEKMIYFRINLLNEKMGHQISN